MTERQTKIDAFVRVCKDSGFRLGHLQAAQIAAGALRISALEVWIAVGTLDTMKQIAAGQHPVCKEDQS